jgi:hypothetical protein
MYRSQFVLGLEPCIPNETWRAEKIANNLVLSAQSSALIKRSSDGASLLFGTAFDGEADKGTVQEQLSNISDVAASTYTWAGTWALFHNGQLFPDASGLRSIYYGRFNGRLVASTSAGLLAAVLGAPRATSRQAGWGGLSWYPPPRSAFRGIRKLLPDQLIDFRNEEVREYSRRSRRDFSRLSRVEKVAAAIRMYTAVFKAAAGDFRSLSLALTAGTDSRTSLGLMMRANVKFRSFTIVDSFTDAADGSIPGELAARFGFEHRYVFRQRPKRAKRTEYDRHTGGLVRERDRMFYAAGQYDALQLGTRDAVVRSGCLELGRAYFHRAFPEECSGAVSAERILRSFKSLVGRSEAKAAFRDWLRWVRAHPEPMAFFDRFYRDQRLCGWVSAIEQSLEVMKFRSLQLFNMTALYDLLLSEPFAARSAAELQHEIIASCDQRLVEVPFNPRRDSRLRWISIKARQAALLGFTELYGLARPLRARGNT